MMILTILAIGGATLQEADALAEAGSYKEALTIYGQLVDQGDQAALLGAVTCADRLGDYARGLELADKALAAYPDDPRLKVQIADLYQRKFSENPMGWMTGKGKYIGLLEDAIRLDPKTFDAYQRLIGFYLQAPPIAGGSESKALEWCDKLAEIDPLEAGIQRAQVYVAKGRDDAWRDAFTALLKQHPQPRVRYRFGLALTQAKDFDAAIAQFDLAAAQGHAPSIYQAGRARVLADREPDIAIGHLEHYLQLGADSPAFASGAWWRMGQAHLIAKRESEAKHCFEKALEIDPDNKAVLQALEALK